MRRRRPRGRNAKDSARTANQIHAQACCSAVPLHPHRSTQFSYQRHPTCDKTCCSLSAPPKQRFTDKYASSTTFKSLQTCILLRCSKLFLLLSSKQSIWNTVFFLQIQQISKINAKSATHFQNSASSSHKSSKILKQNIFACTH